VLSNEKSQESGGRIHHSPNHRRHDTNEDAQRADFEFRRRSHAEERMKAFLAREPERAERNPSWYKWVVVAIFLAISVGTSMCVAIEWTISTWIGKDVAWMIRKQTPGSMGIKANFHCVRVNLWRGSIHIYNMRLHNPKSTPKYTTDYLFHADEIVIAVKTGKLLRSKLQDIEIDLLKFHNIKVAYERPHIFGGKSNVKDVKDFMDAAKKEKKTSWLSFGKKKEEKPEEKPETKPADADAKRFVVHEVDCEGIKVEAKIKGADVIIPLPEIKKDDLSKECEGTEGKDIVHALVHAMAKGLIHH
jgi:hypothetical protein